MTPEMRGLLKEHNVHSLKELSGKLNISLNKIKNISSGRTSIDSLFKIKKQHAILPKHSAELAELIGVVLGDGNIFKFDRCQRLTISCNGAYEGYTDYVGDLVRYIFEKEPVTSKRSGANCQDVCIYMQDMDKALGLPAGNKIVNSVKIPSWVFRRKEYLRRCLKGLFETDGCYGSNKKHSVEYIEFCNRCASLLQSVFEALVSLGYSPQAGDRYVRLAKKSEVRKFICEMAFTRPFPSLVGQ